MTKSTLSRDIKFESRHTNTEENKKAGIARRKAVAEGAAAYAAVFAALTVSIVEGMVGLYRSQEKVIYLMHPEVPPGAAGKEAWKRRYPHAAASGRRLADKILACEDMLEDIRVGRYGERKEDHLQSMKVCFC